MRVERYHIVALLMLDALVGIVVLSKFDGGHPSQVYRAAGGAVICSSPDSAVVYQSRPALRPVLRCRQLAEGMRVRRADDRLGASLGLWKVYATDRAPGRDSERGWGYASDFRLPDGSDIVEGLSA